MKQLRRKRRVKLTVTKKQWIGIVLFALSFMMRFIGAKLLKDDDGKK